jgi:hypothetical protein
MCHPCAMAHGGGGGRRGGLTDGWEQPACALLAKELHAAAFVAGPLIDGAISAVIDRNERKLVQPVGQVLPYATGSGQPRLLAGAPVMTPVNQPYPAASTRNLRTSYIGHPSRASAVGTAVLTPLRSQNPPATEVPIASPMMALRSSDIEAARAVTSPSFRTSNGTFLPVHYHQAPCTDRRS